jgi:hypothetical protein
MTASRPNLLPIGSEPLRHGYRLSDIHRYALMAAASRYTPRSLPHHDRVDIAWHAIVETLYEATDYPSPNHLCHIGAVAISRATDREDHHAGLTQRTRQPAPRFAKFWANLTDNGHEDAVVDRIALTQVLTLLPPEQRAALIALASLGNRDAASKALGLTHSGLDSRLLRARAVIYAAWHEGQTPPARRRDYRVHTYTQVVTA